MQRCFGLWASSVLLAALACPASAQLHRATDPVMTPASALVQQDDAFMVDLNPAGVALLPSWSLAYVHAEVDQRDSYLGRGDAVYVAAPLFFGLAGGFTLQSIRPGPLAARPIAGNADRALGAFTLAYSPDKRFGVGITMRGIASGNSSFDGLAGFDLGAMWRPASWLSISVLGRDLFISRVGHGTAGLDLGSSFQGGISVRPWGTSDLTLDASLVVDGRPVIAGRAGVGLRIPHVGFAHGVVEAERLGDRDAALRLLAELAVSWGAVTLAGGGTGGDDFEGTVGWYGMLRVDGAQRPGLPGAARVLDLELAGLGPRGMAAAALALDRARHDPRINGVLLRPRGSGMGPAYAQEVRLLIQSLQAAGKPVVCHLTSASGPEYYACAAATEVLIDPAGSVRLLGSAVSVILFGDTLKKVGVRADFVRIGEFKSAPEQFTQNRMSEPARMQTRTLLDDVHNRQLADLAQDLNVGRQQVAAIMDDGPHLAGRAKEAGLVRGAVDEMDIDEEHSEALGGRRMTRQLPRPFHRRWGIGSRLGVVMIDGNIVDGKNVDIPFFNIHMTGGRTAVEAIDGMAADPTVRAIVLRVDSPGGAVVASDQIWRAVRRARKRKPVVASMGRVAASGGYYVASAADEIWADPSTITGSIGIFYGKVDVEGLADKIGVSVEHFKRGKRAGAETIWRPFTDDERSALAVSMRTYYRLFLERVGEGRDMTPEAVDKLARGRVYSGDRALSVGLVDRLGGFGSALTRARKLAGLQWDAEVVVRPKRPGSLLDYLLGDGPDVQAEQEDFDADAEHGVLPLELSGALQMLITLEQMGAAEPLALMPFTLEM